MEWTQQVPYVPGFYYFFEEHWTEGDIRICEARLADLAMGVGLYFFFAGDAKAYDVSNVGMGSYWYGPLEVPNKV